ncbi:DUF4265 domain-containing protein (plasmid) [Aeromicrobium yanjiei]|uniref:DUF4265 domain-containing protein n=2 Tax=Aeromicrobium yanjiei TaxID=2662028 RepID=A0A5Q2ME10_9ACTN|nr:DUF4265 domain-containing protein [Aeromicrobium yanjiei]
MSWGEATHRDPTWRHRSDFIIAIEIDPGDTGITTEQLWARKLDERHFELCCIPFFAYDLALGDVAEVDDDFLVRRVTTASGRYVFRVHFDNENCGLRDDVVLALAERGALVEWSSASMFAVDARDALHGQAIAAYLQSEESQGRLIYETGKTG